MKHPRNSSLQILSDDCEPRVTFCNGALASVSSQHDESDYGAHLFLVFSSSLYSSGRSKR